MGWHYDKQIKGYREERCSEHYVGCNKEKGIVSNAWDVVTNDLEFIEKGKSMATLLFVIPGLGNDMGV